MSDDWNRWLADAVALLEQGPQQAPTDEAIDEMLASGKRLEVAGMSPGDVDQVQVERVLACLRARRAALGAELGDLARRRAALQKARAGNTGYLNAAEVVPIH